MLLAEKGRQEDNEGGGMWRDVEEVLFGGEGGIEERMGRKCVGSERRVGKVVR